MKKIIILIFCICAGIAEVRAAVLFIAYTDDPKKAEKILILTDSANKNFLEKRRSDLIKKHALKKAITVAETTKKIVLQDSELKTKSLPSNTSMDIEVDAGVLQSKDIDTQKSK